MASPSRHGDPCFARYRFGSEVGATTRVYDLDPATLPPNQDNVRVQHVLQIDGALCVALELVGMWFGLSGLGVMLAGRVGLGLAMGFVPHRMVSKGLQVSLLLPDPPFRLHVEEKLLLEGEPDLATVAVLISVLQFIVCSDDLSNTVQQPIENLFGILRPSSFKF